MLTHHIINAKVESASIKDRKGGVPSVAGDKIELDGSEGALKADNANIVQADVIASNGVLHVVDQVLTPGAAPAAPTHRSKENVGSVSFSGGSGTNTTNTVDGADNQDYRYSGPLLTYTTESLEQFQLATHRFSAADGRTGGAALTMVTKSGTNTMHGSAFVFLRDEAMMAKDYFSRVANRDKVPFGREQFGGSFGGPLVRNRLFFFGALEQVLEDSSLPVPATLYGQKQLLVDATAAGLLPGASRAVGRAGVETAHRAVTRQQREVGDAAQVEHGAVFVGR